MQTPFSVRDIVPYLATVEKNTMAALGDQVRDPSSPNYYSVFGRNGSRDRTRCMEDKSETWNPCGYDSMRAIYRGAMRTGNEDVLDFCARSAAMAVRQWPAWIQRWGQPPGEDSRYPPCGSMEEGKGDTDPDRHIIVLCFCIILSDPEMRRRSGLTTQEILRFAEAHWQWILLKVPHLLSHQREYLRYGFVGDSLLGLEQLYRSLGMAGRAMECLQAATWLFWHIYQPGWQTVEIGQDGAEWPIWNYGDLEQVQGFGTSVCVEPFEGVLETRTGPEFDDRAELPYNYGWRRFGSQSWYDGYLFNFLRNFWSSIVRYFGPEHPAAARAFQVFDIQFKWYHPEKRLGAPLGDLAGPDAQDFVNAKLHGWTKTGVLEPGETPMTVPQWALLPDDRPYHRGCRTTDYHESDQHGYHQKRFQDANGVWHDRVHKGHVGIPWNSPDSAYVPGFESRGNNYLIPDATFTWAIMFGDIGVKDFALCQAFDYVHDTSSDSATTKGKRIQALAPPANQMGWARPWNWAVQCGDYIREVMLGLG